MALPITPPPPVCCARRSRAISSARTPTSACSTRCADDRSPAGLAGRRANRAIEKRRAEAIEEAAIHRSVLEQAHRARVAVGQDCLRAVSRIGNSLELRGDRADGLIPRNAFELPLPLRANPFHRIEQPVAVVDAVEIVGHFLAEKSPGKGMLRIAAELDGAAVLDRDDEPARIGAIVRADGTDGSERSLHDYFFGRNAFTTFSFVVK